MNERNAIDNSLGICAHSDFVRLVLFHPVESLQQRQADRRRDKEKRLEV